MAITVEMVPCRQRILNRDQQVSGLFVNGLDICGDTPFQELVGKNGTKIDFQEYMDWGILLRIPRLYLFGRQRREEYSPYKEKLIEARLKRCGIKCLEAHPLVTCLLPFEAGSAISVVDGHHRGRYSGKFGIDSLPCMVFTPSILAAILNKHGDQIDGRYLTTMFGVQMRDAMESFRADRDENSYPPRKGMPKAKESRFIEATSVEQLQSMFPAFSPLI